MLIKELPSTERPRERLLKYGVKSLSNEELLAILLKNGTKGNSVRDLAILVLKRVGDIQNFKNMTIHSFDNIKGLGLVKKMEVFNAYSGTEALMLLEKVI